MVKKVWVETVFVQQTPVQHLLGAAELTKRVLGDVGAVLLGKGAFLGWVRLARIEWLGLTIVGRSRKNLKRHGCWLVGKCFTLTCVKKILFIFSSNMSNPTSPERQIEMPSASVWLILNRKETRLYYGLRLSNVVKAFNSKEEDQLSVSGAHHCGTGKYKHGFTNHCRVQRCLQNQLSEHKFFDVASEFIAV